jgi:hypothetical protein
MQVRVPQVLMSGGGAADQNLTLLDGVYSW